MHFLNFASALENKKSQENPRHLSTIKIPVATQVVTTSSSVHRYFMIDVSGSMWRDLPHLRTQLKNKIPQLTNTGDTVSISYFSSRGDSWFSDLGSLDQNSLDVVVDGVTFSCKAELVDIVVKL